MDWTWASKFFTVCVFVSFVLVLFIVFNKYNKQNYQDAARSIIDDPDTPVSGSVAQSKHENGA